MKYLLVILGVIGLCFAALNVPEHLKAPTKIMRRACMAESGIDEKYLNESKNGYLADVPEMGCYMLCIFEHAGMIEDDGTIHFGPVLHMLSPDMKETAEYVSKECSKPHGEKTCETAFYTIKCFFEKAPEGSELP